MHDAVRLLVEDGGPDLGDVLGTELAGEGQGPAGVGDVVDDEQALCTEEGQVRNRWKQERLGQTLGRCAVFLKILIQTSSCWS